MAIRVSSSPIARTTELYLLVGDGKGTLAPPAYYYPGGGNPSGLTVADFNNDGALDVVVADPATSSFMVLYNTGGTSIKLTSSNVKPLAGQSVTFTTTLAASIAGIRYTERHCDFQKWIHYARNGNSQPREGNLQHCSSHTRRTHHHCRVQRQ